jgi:hypothetical protein
MQDASEDVLANRSMWTWLTLLHFDVLCPAGTKIGEDARYVLSDNPMRYYRHLLYGPYLVVKAHKKESKGLAVLLGNPVDTPGDIWEQIASRQELISSRKIVEVIGRLYYDSERSSYVSGAATADAGAVRRFVRVMQQLDCTWDLWEIPVDDLLEMLPPEFDRFLVR